MPTAFPINRIEPQKNTEQKYRSDGSFNNDLEQAILKLCDGNYNSGFFPLDQLFSQIGIISDSTNNAQDGTNTKEPEKEPGSKKASNDSNPQNIYSTDNTPKKQAPIQQASNNDIKTIKQALIKFIETSNTFAYGLSSSSLSGISIKSVSKLDMQAMIDEIVENAKIVKSKNLIELSLMLNEKSLGEISVLLTSKSGLVSIQIAASPEIKKQLEDSMAELEQALKLAEIDIDKIKINEIIRTSQAS